MCEEQIMLLYRQTDLLANNRYKSVPVCLQSSIGWRYRRVATRRGCNTGLLTTRKALVLPIIETDGQTLRRDTVRTYAVGPIKKKKTSRRNCLPSRITPYRTLPHGKQYTSAYWDSWSARCLTQNFLRLPSTSRLPTWHDGLFLSACECQPPARLFRTTLYWM